MSSEPPKWLIDNIAEASINARKLFFLYIGFISYCALTVVSTTDRQLVIGGVVKLPVINVEVGLTGFFIIAPAIAIILYVYFQLYLRRLNALKERLRVECPGVDEMRLYPWMINMVETPEPGFGGWLQRRFVSFSLWWSLPLLLMLFGLWFLKKHEPILSYLVGALPVAGALLALYFRQINEKRVNNTLTWLQWVDTKILHALYSRLVNEDEANKMTSQVERVMLWYDRYTLPMYLIIFEFFFIFYLTPLALKGDLHEFTVDLSYQKLITEPKEEQDYEELYWGDFNGLNLRGANLESVVLKRADLRGANLKWADLGGANLQEADLDGAILTQAYLQEANLLGANLRGANLEEADLEGANLRKVENLEPKQIKSARNWLFAFYSDEHRKELGLFEDHNDRVAKRNFSNFDLRDASLWGADLRGAGLENANLARAFLLEANLEKADLREAKLAEAWLIDANLKGANLWGANLEKASLLGAKLKGADLRGADLRGANLWGADLEGAKNLTLEQLSWVETLYEARGLNPGHLKVIEEYCPQLRKEPKMGYEPKQCYEAIPESIRSPDSKAP